MDPRPFVSGFLTSFCLLPLLAGMLIFSGCKKQYEEDPKRTIKSPSKRLLGTWHIVEYTFNDESIIEKMNAQFGNRFNILDLRLFYKKDSQSLVLHLGGDNVPFYSIRNRLDVHFIVLGPTSPEHGGNDTVLSKWLLNPFKYSSVGFSNTRTQWEITKLFKDDFNVQMKTDTGDFRIFWKK